jgi:Proto-chlorophyllide reductase 57 kD subunit
MKFLCVPCDTPMKLQTVAPPERGSLSIVYSCPECGYEIAMLTNAYETQAVQSLGVRIGPEASRDRLRAEGAPASPAEASAEAGCPFASMIPATEDAQPFDGAQGKRGQVADPTPVRWTAAAEARLAKVPAFVRPMAKAGIERFARDNGCLEVDEKILEAAREFFGM